MRAGFAWGLLAGVLGGCSVLSPQSGHDPRRLTIEQIEGLRSLEQDLPIPPDSAAERYRLFDRSTFHATYGAEIAEVARLIDSLNLRLPRDRRVDTLSIDHTMEGLGNAASRGRTLFLSSSYFYLFPGTAVLRSVVFHEFGHVHHRLLDTTEREELGRLWAGIRSAALFYLFRDGEYSGNARFGGHPEESPGELFSSGFNLFWNRPEEIAARLRYVESRHLPLIDRFRSFVLQASR